MAHIRRTKVKITKEVPGYQLTLTEGEADFLVSVLSEVGGSDTQSPRKYADSIQRALNSMGLDFMGADAFELMRGEITFSKYPKSTRRYQ